jgi:hypothetical protein
MVMLQDLQVLAKSSHNKPIVNIGPSTTTAESSGPVEVDGFREQRRRKRTSLGEKEAKKGRVHVHLCKGNRNSKLRLGDCIAPLRSADMDYSEQDGGDKQDEQQTSAAAGRPPLIVLAACAYLMQLQKDIKGLVKGTFKL